VLSGPLLSAVAPSKRSRALSDAVELVCLLMLEGAVQLLDSAPDDKPTLRARTVQRLERALNDARSLAGKT
jgi:hypothetical protein